ncbi:MAG: DUF1540 domain-containing protein [Bacillota bacterium]
MKSIPVRCTVNSCHYWKSGNECHASGVLVTSDSFADRQPDSVDAHVANTLGPTPTGSCMETCCKTFVNKDAAAATHRSDGTLKH